MKKNYILKTFIQELEKNNIKLSNNIIVKGDFYNKNVNATWHGHYDDLCIYIPKNMQNDLIDQAKNGMYYLYVGYAYENDVAYLTINDLLQKLKEIKMYPNSEMVFVIEDEEDEYEIHDVEIEKRGNTLIINLGDVITD